MATEKKKIIAIPLNRVEGDLELKVEIQDNIVTDAWCCGIMYRGFENMLKGRAPKDGLVLTPRVCGICGTSHLLAAAKALDMICGVAIPENALLVRNLTSMAEHLQSDMRHAVLMFMKDFATSAYRDASFFQEAVKRYEPFKGSSVLTCIKATKHVVEIIAIIGGQWPNSSYMVPGGVASTMSHNDITSCRYIITKFNNWYEKHILGCTIERWNAITSAAELERWYEESDSHRNSEIGFFMRCCRQTGLNRIGSGHERFISFGQFEKPDRAHRDSFEMLLKPGIFSKQLKTFDQINIGEHVRHSRFQDYEGGKHPFRGKTIPFMDGPTDVKYSFTKAPRYNNKPAETGPLAEMLCTGISLFTDLVKHQGSTVFVRQLARFARGALLLPSMHQWLRRIVPTDPFYSPIPFIPDGKGYGLTGGCRGALGHWVEIANGAIEKYQIITPTAWNGSPRDSNHVRGPLEEAIINTPVPDSSNLIDIEHVVRSFDPCQVCSVHAVKKNA